MKEITPLSEFKDELLESKPVLKLIKQHYGKQAAAKLEQFRAGQMDELIELIEEDPSALAREPEDWLEAAGPEDDTFHVEIWAAGPAYWIHANEFEDIGYFRSFEEARDYAFFEYESYIAELAERREREDEDGDAWLKEHLRNGTCPVCRGPQSACNHLLADIDLTFGSFDAGTLGALYAEFCERQDEAGESEEDNALEEFRGILEDHVNLHVECAGDDTGAGPMSSSRNVWFWHENPAAIEARLRRQLLG